MNRRKMFSLAAIFGSAVTGFAQETRERVVTSSHGVVVTSEGAAGAMTHGPGTFAFVSASAVEAGETVANAPYSAEAVSETTRILGDGTRIVNKNSTMMARDKEGRTRREVMIGNIGPWASTGHEPPRFVTITDPVAKEVYVLNLTEKTARKSKFGEPHAFHSETASGNKTETIETRVHVTTSGSGTARNMIVGAPGMPLPGTGANATYFRFDPKNSKKESLGKRSFEGVEAEGTRTTNTIPAGEIGNDRPIVSTEERWYSPELKMVVYSKTVDPQFGETEYRVTNIRRSEPDASQFKVPGEFKLNENPGTEPFLIRKKIGTTI